MSGVAMSQMFQATHEVIDRNLHAPRAHAADIDVRSLGRRMRRQADYGRRSALNSH